MANNIIEERGDVSFCWKETTHMYTHTHTNVTHGIATSPRRRIPLQNVAFIIIGFVSYWQGNLWGHSKHEQLLLVSFLLLLVVLVSCVGLVHREDYIYMVPVIICHSHHFSNAGQSIFNGFGRTGWRRSGSNNRWCWCGENNSLLFAIDRGYRVVHGIMVRIVVLYVMCHP